MTVQELAKQALKAITIKTRDNGEQFYCFSDDAPEWCQDMSHDAHGHLMPDDIRYEFIRDALSALTYHDSIDDERDSLEASCYTRELTAWLASSISRVDYVDQAIEDFGKGESLTDDLMTRQLLEMQEVFESVVSFSEGLEFEEVA